MLRDRCNEFAVALNLLSEFSFAGRRGNFPAMKIRMIAALFCLLCLGAPLAAQAQESLRAAIAACAGLTDEDLRIDCFDALAGMTADDPEVAAEAPPEPGSARTFPVDSRPADAPAAEPSAAEPPASEPPAAVAENQDLYGFENRATEHIDRIQSRHVGRFEGWSGDTVFPLENGQVWRQAESGRLGWVAGSPLITIEKGWFGSFRLSVEGLNTSLRVERIE